MSTTEAPQTTAPTSVSTPKAAIPDGKVSRLMANNSGQIGHRPRIDLRKAVGLGLTVVLLGAGLLFYEIHSSSSESTDDAYIAGHVHSISSRVAGTVLSVVVDDNQPVKQGQVLVQLDPRDFQIEVDKAQAEYERAEADYQRDSVLRGEGAISQQEYDKAMAVMQIAKATLDDKNNRLSYCTILAPSKGVVGNKTVQTGNRLAEGTELMSIVEDVWVVANYKETQVGKMHPGQLVRIHVDEIPGHLFLGHVDSLSPGSGSTFALLPPENATGNFTKIVQRVPVKILFDPESVRGYEHQLQTGLSVETEVAIEPTPRS